MNGKFIIFVVVLSLTKGEQINQNEDEIEDINEAEFYVADEDNDDTTCMFDKNEDLILKRCGFNPSKSTVEELSYFYPEVEAKMLEFSVKTNRKLLAIYLLITKSARQREKLINILVSKNGKNWLKQLKNVGSLVWKNSAKIIEALITPFEEFNSKMLNKRFNYLTKSVKKLLKLIPDTLQESRELPNSRENIEKISEEIKSNIHYKIQNVRSKSEFKFNYLADLIGKNSPEIITEAFRKLKYNYNYSLIDKIKKGCIKMSFIDLAIKFLHDPFGYYATHVKILLDQKDFGYYLSRLFFAYPKQKLLEVSKAFKQIYKVALKDYIKSRLNELNQSSFDKMTGRYEEYSSYLRAMLASIGDVEWCSGSCQVTQK